MWYATFPGVVRKSRSNLPCALELEQQLVRIDHRGGEFFDVVAGEEIGYSRRIVSEQVGLIAAIL